MSLVVRRLDVDRTGLLRRVPTPRIALRGLALVAALAVAAAVVMTVTTAGERSGPDAIAEARKAGSTSLESMLSYDQSSVSGIADVAEKLTTKSFGKEYRELVETDLLPTVGDTAITVETVVAASGVVDGGDSSVELIYFLNQNVTTGGQQSSSGSRVRVRMQRAEDGSWLIADIEPV